MRLKAVLMVLMLCSPVVWWACSTERDAEQPVPVETQNDSKSQGSPSFSQVPYLTLDYFQNLPNTNLIPVPSGYMLEKAGLWQYSEVYLLIGQGISSPVEVYVFEDVPSYDIATGCDLNWLEDIDAETKEVVAVGCATGGSNCSSSGNCLTKCLPAA